MKQRVFKFKYHSNMILLIIALAAYFAILRFSGTQKTTFFVKYYQTYNERRFLGLFLSVFLLSLFPTLKKMYITEIVVRNSSKWNYIISIFKEICLMSFAYSVMISIGWYFIIGTGTTDWILKENCIYMGVVLFTQIIGWIMIGMVELLVYIWIKNLPVSFIVCDMLFIMTNLSLYLSNDKRYISFVRLYDFMYDLLKIDDIFTIASIGFLYIAIIMLLIWLSYFSLKINDFMPGGKKSYAR